MVEEPPTTVLLGRTPRLLEMRSSRMSGRQKTERKGNSHMAVVNILAWVIVGGIAGWLTGKDACASCDERLGVQGKNPT